MNKPKWLALGYTVPATPSKARVYVWRTLKKFGAQSFKPTVAILPNTTQNLKSFNLLADKIRQLEGEAWIVELNFISAEDNEEMQNRFRSASLERCQQLMDEIKGMMERLRSPDEQQSDLLISELKKIQKDYQKNFVERDDDLSGHVESAMTELRSAIMGMRNELGTLRGLWGKMVGISSEPTPDES